MKNPRLALGLTTIIVLVGASYALFLKVRQGGLSRLPTAVAKQDESPVNADAVLTTYKLLEKAVQTGDGNLYLSLQSQRKLDEAADKQALEQFREGLPANPSVRYEVLGARTRDDHAAVLGKITDSSGAAPQYYLAKFVLEKGSWKIAEDLMDANPINAAALEAAVPPKDGAFTRAGSPWSNVPYAAINTKWFKENEINWKLQAAQDESFVYIRFKSKEALPAPGTEIPAADAKAFKGIPSAPDVMVITTANGKEFSLVLGANPMTRATFDENGRAASNRYFVEYSFTLRNAAHEPLFSGGTKDALDPLIAMQDRVLDIKIPLKCLAVSAPSSGIEIREANSLAKILPYQVGQFWH